MVPAPPSTYCSALLYCTVVSCGVVLCGAVLHFEWGNSGHLGPIGAVLGPALGSVESPHS